MNKIIVFMIMMLAFVPFAIAQEKQIEVRIYLQKDTELPDNLIRSDWVYVKRKVDAKTPLKGALERFFNPQLTADEEKQKIYETHYGMKFEGVTLRNGTATVRFSETGESNYGTASGGLFAEGITKTAKQFPSVKRVKICVVGETNLDGEYDRRIFLPCK